MSTLSDVFFPEHISLYEFKGNTGWKTEVTEMQDGGESRNIIWSQARRSWDAGLVPRPASQWKAIDDLFNIVKGRGYGFLLKDHKDYAVAATEGLLQPLDSSGNSTGTIGYAYGAPSYQLYRRSSNGSHTFDRKITRPKAGSYILYKNAVALTEGVAAGNYALDTATGIVTFVADASKNVDANSAKTITAITKASPGQVTCVGHGFASGDKPKITGVVGMTQVNNLYFTITVVDADHYTIGVDTSGYSTYTSGGTATKYGITQTSPIQVNSAAHTFNNGDVIYIASALGMTQVNGLPYMVGNKTTNRFELSAVNGSAYSAYASAGVLKKYAQPTDALTFSSEFYVPIRFDTDNLPWETVNHEPGFNGQLLITVPSIPLIELRE